MEFLNKNQKIILIGIVAIMCFTIIYYIINKSMKNGFEEFEEIMEVSSEEQKNITNEEDKTIIVYIVGEVENSGIVELEEGSRIADAIKKARRSYYKCRFIKNKFSIYFRRWAKSNYSKFKRRVT